MSESQESLVLSKQGGFQRNKGEPSNEKAPHGDHLLLMVGSSADSISHEECMESLVARKEQTKLLLEEGKKKSVFVSRPTVAMRRNSD